MIAVSNFRIIVAFVLALPASGCFYPPTTAPPPPSDRQTRIPIPFDLAWDAVRSVIVRNDFNIIAEDPNNGVIESEAPGGFSLKQADCGKLRTVATKYDAKPNDAATAVYNFTVKPAGDEAATVSVQATYRSQLHVPIRPLTDEPCVSRGVAEAALLKQIEKQAKLEHRPSFKPSAD